MQIQSKPKQKAQKKSGTEQSNQMFSSDQQQQAQQSKPQIPVPQAIKPSISFSDDPIQLKCPFCVQNIRTQIILKPQFISIIFGFSLFLVLPHFLTIFLVIVVLQITATRKHRCPLCERELGTDGKFLVFFRDEVYSFALGTNGLIVSKKILVSIAIGVLVLVILTVKMNYANQDLNFTQLTWEQFYRECPKDENSKKCQTANEGLTVKDWHGYVMRVQDNRNSIRRHFQHAVSIFIKMNDPSTLQQNKQSPDLLLTLNSYQAHILSQSLDSLSHGQQIIFNGTFKYLRNNRNIALGRHLNLIDFNKTGHQNNNIHVYMSKDEDKWFFQHLSGDKLRKHQEEVEGGEMTREQIIREIQEILTGEPKVDQSVAMK